MQRSRLKKDLSVVYEKIRLCRELLFDSQGAAHDQPLAELVGFLEACEPLLRGLIEVGSKSLPASHDPILAEVFRLHAALLATLHAEKASPAHQLSYPLPLRISIRLASLFRMIRILSSPQRRRSTSSTTSFSPLCSMTGHIFTSGLSVMTRMSSSR